MAPMVQLEVAMVAGVIIRAVLVVAHIGWTRRVLRALGVLFPEVRLGAKVASAMAVVWAAISGVVACAGVALTRGILAMMMETFSEVMLWAVVASTMAFVWAEVSEVVAHVTLRGSILVSVVSPVLTPAMWTASMVAVFGVVSMLAMARALVSVSMAWIAVHDGIGFVTGYGNRVAVLDVVAIMVTFRRWR